jgi:hypothetical protein
MLFQFVCQIELPKPKLCNGCDFLKGDAKKNNCALGCTNTRKDDTDKFFRGDDCVLVLATPVEVCTGTAPTGPGLIPAAELRARMLTNVDAASNSIMDGIIAAIKDAESKYSFATSICVGIMPRIAWDIAIQDLIKAGYEAEYIADTQGGDFVQVAWLPPVTTSVEVPKQAVNTESAELG